MHAHRASWGGLLAVLLATTPALVGCGPLAKKADCAPELKYKGALYRQVGYTYERAAVAGTAQLAYCDEDGRDPRGSVVDSASTKIQVYALTGYDAAQVVVYAVSGDLYQVFAAESLSSSQVQQLKKSDLLKTG